MSSQGTDEQVATLLEGHHLLAPGAWEDTAERPDLRTARVGRSTQAYAVNLAQNLSTLSAVLLWGAWKTSPVSGSNLMTPVKANGI